MYTVTITDYLKKSLNDTLDEIKSSEKWIIDHVLDKNMHEIMYAKAALEGKRQLSHKICVDILKYVQPSDVLEIIKTNVDHWTRGYYEVKKYTYNLMDTDVTVAKAIQSLSYSFRN